MIVALPTDHPSCSGAAAKLQPLLFHNACRMLVTELFEFIEIETTNTCNRTCSFCKFGLPGAKERAERMSWDIINKIIAELNSLDYRGVLAWYSLNEPLLDKRICDIIRKSKIGIPNATLALVTNGDLLTHQLVNELFDAGLDILRISVYDDATYDKANELMSRFSQIDYFEMRHSHNLSNRAGAISYLPERPDVIHQNCLHPSKNMVINVRGKLKLCCDDMFSSAMPDNYNLTDMTIYELWNSDVMNHYRVELRERGRKDLNLCRNCSFDSSIRWPQ